MFVVAVAGRRSVIKIFSSGLLVSSRLVKQTLDRRRRRRRRRRSQDLQTERKCCCSLTAAAAAAKRLTKERTTQNTGAPHTRSAEACEGARAQRCPFCLAANRAKCWPKSGGRARRLPLPLLPLLGQCAWANFTLAAAAASRRASVRRAHAQTEQSSAQTECEYECVRA